MSLLVVIAALFLGRFLNGAEQVNRSWYVQWEQRAISFFPNISKTGILIIGMLPLIIAVGFLSVLSSQVLWGLGRLLFDTLVLAICMGPRLLDVDIDLYMQARENKDRDLKDRMYWLIVGKQRPENLSEEIRALTEKIFYQAHVRWFAVLFWYLLGGVVCAVIYRTIFQLAQSDRAQGSETANKLYGLLGWMPARISAFFFGLVGSLRETLEAFKDKRTHDNNWVKGNQHLLTHAGCAAIRMEMAADMDENNLSHNQAAINWIRRAKGVVLRTLLLWVAVAAILMMFGV